MAQSMFEARSKAVLTIFFFISKQPRRQRAQVLKYRGGPKWGELVKTINASLKQLNVWERAEKIRG